MGLEDEFWRTVMAAAREAGCREDCRLQIGEPDAFACIMVRHMRWDGRGSVQYIMHSILVNEEDEIDAWRRRATLEFQGAHAQWYSEGHDRERIGVAKVGMHMTVPLHTGSLDNQKAPD